MQATLHSSIHATAQQPQVHVRTCTQIAFWQQSLARWLRELAHWLDGRAPNTAHNSTFLHPKVSHRDDVQQLFTGLSAATREAVCPQPREVQALLRIVHLLKYLPDEPTLLDFTRRVPDWAMLHEQFAAYLLRRLVALRHVSRQPDQSFVYVHRWLQRRNRCLTALPLRWPDAVDASQQRVGEDAAALLDERTAGLSGPRRREVVAA